MVFLWLILGDYGLCGNTINECGLSFWACRPDYGKCGGPEPIPPIGSYPPIDPAKEAPVITHCTKPGQFALTFDDGIYMYTNKLLDLLAEKGVKVTFFINAYKTGDISKEPYRSVLKRMKSEGHHIASHTYDHLDLRKLDIDGIWAQMRRNDKVFKSIVGVMPTFMRPPFGNTNELVRQALGSWGYSIIWNNIFSGDHLYRDATNAIELMRAEYDKYWTGSSPSNSSFIGLQHDHIQVTVEQWVPYIIDIIRSKGYKLVTVGECLEIPENRWYREDI